MKKVFFSLLAAAALVSCSNDDGPKAPEEREGKYLAVALNNAVNGSRADDGNYEDGLAAENDVTDVAFFFYDANGDAYTVDGSGTNYLVKTKAELDDWELQDEKNEQNQNVEVISGAVLVINGSKNTPPASIVAILNISNDLLDKVANKSLSVLQSVVTTSLKNSEGDFLMSNSVYKNESANAAVVATPLMANNICTTSEDALKAENVVDIYVERVAAKVRLNGIADKIAVKDVTDNTKDLEVNGKKVFVEVAGWQVTNVTSESYAVKKINTSWSNETLGFTWNDSPYFRSYWAETDAKLDPSHPYTWNELAAHNSSYDYYFENTLSSTDAVNNVDGTKGGNLHPQILIAASFVDENGAKLDIAKWYGEYYTIDGLKTAMANTQNMKIFVKETATATEAISISADDLEIYQVEATEASSRYLCHVKLKEASESKQFYNVKGEKMTVEQVNAELKAINPAEIWNGMGYYWFEIKHLGKTGTTGEFGLVRNHLYDITISSVVGLGTAVYDPNKIITPEDPGDDTKPSYVAARINILTWRIVSQNVTLQ